MFITKIRALYFSPTGSTREIVLQAARHLSFLFEVPLEQTDYTIRGVRAEQIVFQEGEFAVIGFPTYAGRLPNRIVPDLKAGLEGNNAYAAAVVTFGNRAYDNSLAELNAVLTNSGFRVMAGAAFACRHAFSDLIQPDRPGEKDFEQAREFAEQIMVLLTLAGEGNIGMPEIPGSADAPYYVPKGTDGQPAKFLKAKPVTDLSKCVHCGMCARLCPVAAIDPEDPSSVPGVCIKCQACIRGCEKGARYFDDSAFLSHVAMLETEYTEPKPNEFFYAEQN